MAFCENTVSPLTARRRDHYTTSETRDRVLESFAELFSVHCNVIRVRSYVHRAAGARLSVGIPSDVCVVVRPAEDIRALDRCRDDCVAADAPWPWDGKICCEDWLEPVGEGLRVADGRSEDLGLIFLLGSHFNVWCFDTTSEALYLVAAGLEELARYGLAHLEPLYAKGTLPRATLEPEPVVAALLCAYYGNEKAALRAAGSREEAREPRSHRDDPSSPLRVARACYHNRFRTVILRTPGEGEVAFHLCGAIRALGTMWPFVAADSDFAIEMMVYFVRRLACAVWVLGAVGEHLRTGLFHVEVVVLVDAAGAIHGFDISKRELVRLADDLDMFLRIGLAKLYSRGRRHDTRIESARRGEAEPLCVHQESDLYVRYHDALNLSEITALRGHLDWLRRDGQLRDEGYRDQSLAPWYEADPGFRAPAPRTPGARDRSSQVALRFDFPEDEEQIRCEIRPSRVDWPSNDAAFNEYVDKEREYLDRNPVCEAFDQDWKCAGPTDLESVFMTRAARARLADLGYVLQKPWIPLRPNRDTYACTRRTVRLPGVFTEDMPEKKKTAQNRRKTSAGAVASTAPAIHAPAQPQTANVVRSTAC